MASPGAGPGASFAAMSELFGLPREALDRARRSRDTRFEGKFFIAVLSTGIYCRSVCPVRLSSAVRYYATAAEAAAAGFRPCLRCRPEAAPGSPAWSGTSAVVRRTLRLIQEGALDTGSVEDLAARVGIGARHLNRLFVEQVGVSPIAVAQTRRLHFAKQLLDDTDLAITEIALAAGYGSVRRFNGAFKATYKRAPRDLRKRRVPGDPLDAITLRLSYRPPYEWSRMLSSLGRQATPGVERVDGAGYARAVATTSGFALVRIRPCPDAHAIEMQVRGALPADLIELSSAARRVFDLAADPAQITAAFCEDPVLGRLVIQRPGLRIPGAWDPFECAVRAVLEQQIGSDEASTIMGRLARCGGRPIAAAEEGLTHLFPTPEALAEMELSGLGLAADPITALRELACSVRVHEHGPHLADAVEAAVRALARAAAFGPCVVQLVALRGLGEPDAFPVGDPALRRRASGNTHSLTARALEARAEVWRPWRSYAAVHLWAATDIDPLP